MDDIVTLAIWSKPLSPELLAQLQEYSDWVHELLDEEDADPDIVVG